MTEVCGDILRDYKRGAGGIGGREEHQKQYSLSLFCLSLINFDLGVLTQQQTSVVKNLNKN